MRPGAGERRARVAVLLAAALCFGPGAGEARDKPGTEVQDPLYGEVLAVREEDGRFEVVPADTLINLPAHASPPGDVAAIDPGPAADFVKSTYQLERRETCQQERERFASVIRDYLEKSFDTRIKRAQVRPCALPVGPRRRPNSNWPPTRPGSTRRTSGAPARSG